MFTRNDRKPLTTQEDEEGHRYYAQIIMAGSQDKLSKEAFRVAMKSVKEKWNSMDNKTKRDYYNDSKRPSKQVSDVPNPPKASGGMEIWVREAKRSEQIRTITNSADESRFLQTVTKEWNSLPETEKNVYNLQSVAEHDEYSKNMALLQNQIIPPRRGAASVDRLFMKKPETRSRSRK